MRERVGEAARPRRRRRLGRHLPLDLRAPAAPRDRAARPAAELRDLRRVRVPGLLREALRRHGSSTRAARTRGASTGASTSGRTPGLAPQAAAAQRARPRGRRAPRRALPQLPGAARRGQRPRLRRPPATHRRALRRAPGRARPLPGALAVRAGRRVPGHQPRPVPPGQRSSPPAHRNLCVVGDPNQSIYGWRGADIRNILDFERDFPDATVVKLERNYRSTQPILPGANAVVAHNLDRRELVAALRARRGRADPAVPRAATSATRRSSSCRASSRAARSDGRPSSHFAVFYRTNAQSRPLEEELLKYDVPYVVVGGVRFYDRAEVKDVLAYLRLVVNRADAMALRRIVNVPARGIGKATARARRGARRGSAARRSSRGCASRPARAARAASARRRVPGAAGAPRRRAAAPRARRGDRPRARAHRLPARARGRGHARGRGARREPARARRRRRGLRERGPDRRGHGPHASSSSSSTRWRWSPTSTATTRAATASR